MRQVRIELPAVMEFCCPSCRAIYSISSRQLGEAELIYCPLCGLQSSLYDSLDGEVRRRIYHAVRDALEHRIYEQQQMDKGDYFEDQANLS
jgi:hypothetical protein